MERSAKKRDEKKKKKMWFGLTSRRAIWHVFYNLIFLSAYHVLYISTSIWMLRTPNAIVIFSVFCAKKPKKARNLQQNFAKNMFFLVCTRTLVDCKKCWKWLFRQRLECAAPKRWSNYTTIMLWVIPTKLEWPVKW